MKFNKTILREYLKTSIFIAEEEIPVFCHYVSLAKDILIDIGAGWGTSAFLMLVNAPNDSLVFSIDPFGENPIKPWKRTDAETCKKNVFRALIKIGEKDNFSRWKLFITGSHSVAVSWSKEIDLIYIDGDHRYARVKRDFEDWFKFIKPGGNILLHDSRRLPNMPEKEFARGWAGPTRLAQELRKRKDIDLVNETFSLTIWRKK